MTRWDAVKWCIAKHESTNHQYDKYLPYEFHLKMVERVFEKFKHLLPKKLYVTSYEAHRNMWEEADITLQVIELACWGHDLIEDTRTNYNEIKEALNIWGGYGGNDFVAELIYALTNEKGRNRDERGNDKYYEGIRAVRGADFVKLCDRIANVQYSKMTGSSMYEKYKKENPSFISKIVGRDYVAGGEDTYIYKEMIEYLNNLFSDGDTTE